MAGDGDRGWAALEWEHSSPKVQAPKCSRPMSFSSSLQIEQEPMRNPNSVRREPLRYLVRPILHRSHALS